MKVGVDRCCHLDQDPFAFGVVLQGLDFEFAFARPIFVPWKINKKLAKNLSDGTQQFIDGTLKSTNKIAKDFSNNSKNIYKQFEKGNITEGIKGTGNLVSSSFGKIVDNQYLNIILKVIIAVYTAFTIPHISKGFAYFFDNLIVLI